MSTPGEEHAGEIEEAADGGPRGARGEARRHAVPKHQAPATPDEIRAAAVQVIRKVSGFTRRPK
jgi:hypothetical protein